MEKANMRQSISDNNTERNNLTQQLQEITELLKVIVEQTKPKYETKITVKEYPLQGSTDGGLTLKDLK